jgi:hypothetical protein
MLDGDVTDSVEARSLSHRPDHVDIYSASWYMSFFHVKKKRISNVFYFLGDRMIMV